ncbi:MerR family transcriptional regulator [Oenococcus sicerae]|uniref:MerR family transcriptional regulator n=1 Tax=Oenococcus sicerae TaxID=2203724 RepID=UPI0039EB2619
MLSVKDVSKRLHLTAYTIRYYDDQGLFPNTNRDVNNQRQFAEDDLVWIHTIDCFRQAGMTVKELRHYTDLVQSGPSTQAERYQMILKLQKKAVSEMAAIQKRMIVINRKLAFYGQALTSDEKNQS